MSLTYSQVKSLVHELNPILQNATVVHIGIQESGKFLFTFKKHAHEYFVLICLNAPFVRFHLVKKKQKKFESSLFTQMLNKELHGLTLQHLEVINDDRIIQLSFQSSSLRVVVELFSKGANLYLIDKEHIIGSALPTSKLEYSPPQRPEKPCDAPSTMHTSSDIEAYYETRESEIAFQQEKERLLKQLTAGLKRAQNNVHKVKAELERCQQWERINHEGMLLQSQLYQWKKGTKVVHVQDWEQENKEIELNVDPLVEPHIEVKNRFKNSKKLKAGIPHQEKQLDKAFKTVTKLETDVERLDQAASWEDLKEFQFKLAPVPKEKIQEKKALPYREFVSKSGFKIWVGKSAANNDVLTFKYANGSDWWLHAHQVPGSHVVIRMGKQDKPDDDTLKDAMQLALKFSKAKGEAEICVTQRKYVSKFGKKGQAHVSQHQLFFIREDKERLQTLMSDNK